MGIDGIDMKQVVLHLADDVAKGGQIAAEHAVAPHPSELCHHGVWGFENTQKQTAVFWILAEFLVDQMHGIAQCTNGRHPNPNIFLPLGHQQEHFQHSRGVFQENVGLDHVDPSIDQSEPFVQRLHGGFLLSDNVFLKVLQDDVVHFRQGHDVAIVMLHEQLNSGFTLGVHEPQTLGQLALSGKVQLVFLASGQGVQAVSNPP